MPSHQIVIAGAGIGGLTSALALSQGGHRVEVLERSPELLPVGAGLTLQINAMRVFARLGLADRLAVEGAVIQKAQVREAGGAVISELALAELSREYGAPCVTIHRGALQAVLLEAVGRDRVRLGAQVTGFEAGERSVAVTSSDGGRREADALVGADGIHSAVRAQLHGDAPPVSAGQVCWRGVCENGGIQPEDRVSESWGKGARFGLVPVGKGRLYWFAVVNAPAPELRPAEQKADLLARFGGWHPEVPQAIEATPAEQLLRAELSDRPVLQSWGKGRVTLLGDAAHPMTPNLGQGACMAIEDALVLADALAGDGPVDVALRRYEASRRERTTATVQLARKVGQIGQWSNGLARAVRNLGVRLTPRAVAERQVRWLFDFRA